jgi:hypothetical protein
VENDKFDLVTLHSNLQYLNVLKHCSKYHNLE